VYQQQVSPRPQHWPLQQSIPRVQQIDTSRPSDKDDRQGLLRETLAGPQLAGVSEPQMLLLRSRHSCPGEQQAEPHCRSCGQQAPLTH
jgi:hypothetical protein